MRHPPATPNPLSRRRRRRQVALAAAVALHVGVGVVVVDALPSRVQRAPRVDWQAANTAPSSTITLNITPLLRPPPEVAPAAVPPAEPPAELAPRPETAPPEAPEQPAESPDVSSPPSPSPPSSVASTSSPPASPASSPPAGTPDRAGDPSTWSSTSWGTPRTGPLPNAPLGSMQGVIVGLDARGPQPSMEGLAGGLDFQPAADRDRGLQGAALAAAKATRSLQRSLAFHDVTMGMASDWFRELDRGIERGLHPTASDLDHPDEVSRAAIMANYLKDPTSWDDEAKRLIMPHLQAAALHSQDPIKRLPLGANAGQGAGSDSTARQEVIEDLQRRKVAGLSVRFAFEIDVHHDGAGAVTAIHVLRDGFERQLVEKMRAAIDDAVKHAAPAPTLVNNHKPFKSTWLLVATWFIDPPTPMLSPSDALGMAPGTAMLNVGSTFEVTDDGIKTSSFDVQQKVDAQLLRVQSLSDAG